ncbi:unnamed protein product [Psylliodes chrysocephalus]|uniref:Phorbol-ester/DAG-type domain-containing protein n=1 Tax=Psylliodes chrysocephalus TaxID=3402493 RepID=A0A9P0CRF6_9CUCU|nr:unnamed protein product [Psylliodes chrysocephala]
MTRDIVILSSNCARCKNVVKTGLTCTVCFTLSHKSCLEKLKNVEFIDDKFVICCGSVGKPTLDMKDKGSTSNIVNSVSQDAIKDLKIKHLEELLKQKDLIIANQEVALEALNNENSLLRKLIPDDFTKPAIASMSPPTNFWKSRKLSSNNHQLSTSATNSTQAHNVVTKAVANEHKGNWEDSKNKISPAAVSYAIHEAKASKVGNDIINLTNEAYRNTSRSNTSFKRKNMCLLVGNNEGSTSCPFKAATSNRAKEFHATNFDVDVNTEELNTYLQSFAPNAKVEKLTARFPMKYASFKITVPSEEADELLVPDIWPAKTIINNFFPSRKLHSEPQSTK